MSCDSKADCMEAEHLCSWPSCQSARSRSADIEFINNVEVGLRAIAGLRLDDLPKTGGKTALMRLQYAICCAKDTLTRSGLATVGPRLAAEQRAIAFEMKTNGNKLPTSWQQERLARARDADRLEGLRGFGGHDARSLQP